MKSCPVCQTEFPDEYRFCNKDASPLMVVNPPVGTSNAKPLQRDYFREIAAGFLVFAIIGLAVLIESASRHRAAAPPFSAASVAAGPGAMSSNGTNNPAPASWTTYRNTALGFSLEYPSSWRAYPPSESGGSTAVIFRPDDANIYVLVNIDPLSGQTPMARWEQFDGRFAKGYKGHYHLMALTKDQIDGIPAARWQFTLQRKQGPLLEKIDLSATTNGRDYALLYSTPTASFSRWQSTFEQITQIVRWHQ